MEFVCSNIDRLITVGIRAMGVPRKNMAKIYEAGAFAGPISLQIVQALAERPGAHVGIFTGAADPVKFPQGENDGPLGSAALARCLDTLGYHVTLYTEPECIGGIQMALEVLKSDVPVVELEKAPGAQYDAIAQELDVAFTIEKLGSNSKGVLHNLSGNKRNDIRAVMDDIIIQMNEMGKLTIGIGDGGNEIGFGNLYEQARYYVPSATVCKCGCGGGIVTTTRVGICYPVAISNWGAYAIMAALASWHKRPELALTPEEEHEMLTRGVEFGLVDGGTGEHRYGLDGIDGDASVACVRLLREIVLVSLKTIHRDF